MQLQLVVHQYWCHVNNLAPGPCNCGLTGVPSPDHHAAIRYSYKHFDGESFDPAQDQARLANQLVRVRNLMLMGGWWSLRELHGMVGGSEAGVSARLRDLRKARFGGYTVERRRVEGGLFEYRIVL